MKHASEKNIIGEVEGTPEVHLSYLMRCLY
jgi:hypothetical protein